MRRLNVNNYDCDHLAIFVTRLVYGLSYLYVFSSRTFVVVAEYNFFCKFFTVKSLTTADVPKTSLDGVNSL